MLNATLQETYMNVLRECRPIAAEQKSEMALTFSATAAGACYCKRYLWPRRDNTPTPSSLAAGRLSIAMRIDPRQPF